MTSPPVKRAPVEAASGDAEGGTADESAGPVPRSALRAPSSGLLSAAFIIMAGNLLSRLFGLGREQLASYYFGTGDGIAPFRVADSLLTILYDLR